MNSALVFCSKLKLSRNIANDQHWSTDHHHVSTLAHHGFQRSFRGCTRLHLLHVSRQHEERVVNGQGNSSVGKAALNPSCCCYWIAKKAQVESRIRKIWLHWFFQADCLCRLRPVSFVKTVKQLKADLNGECPRKTMVLGASGEISTTKTAKGKKSPRDEDKLQIKQPLVRTTFDRKKLQVRSKLNID